MFVSFRDASVFIYTQTGWRLGRAGEGGGGCQDNHGTDGVFLHKLAIIKAEDTSTAAEDADNFIKQGIGGGGGGGEGGGGGGEGGGGGGSGGRRLMKERSVRARLHTFSDVYSLCLRFHFHGAASLPISRFSPFVNR